MFDDAIPGASLEAPESFRVLMAPLWPRLPVAVGYQGGARWVAFYVSSNHVLYNDGAGSSTGDTSLFLAYKRHPVIASQLAGASLGSAHDEVSEWLVIDTQQQVLYIAESDEARRFLAAQWPRYEKPLEYTEAELTRLMEEGQELAALPDWGERVAETMRESRANYRLMQQWLDQHV